LLPIFLRKLGRFAPKVPQSEGEGGDKCANAYALTCPCFKPIC